MQLFKNNDLIKRLIEIDKSILDIYNNLIISDIINDYNMYVEYSNYLKIALEVEKNIYNQFDLITEKDYDDFLLTESYLLDTNYDYDNNEKENIDLRIENYLLTEKYQNIYPTNNIELDGAKIFYQANKDYTTNLINGIDKKIESLTNTELIKSLLLLKYHTTYEFKYLEEYLTRNKKITPNNGREKLLNTAHDQYIVTEIYQSFITDIYSSAIDILINLNFNNKFKNTINEIIQETTLRSCLKMSTIDEIGNLYDGFHSVIINDQDKKDFKNVNKIKAIFNDELALKYNKVMKKNKR